MLTMAIPDVEICTVFGLSQYGFNLQYNTTEHLHRARWSPVVESEVQTVAVAGGYSPV